MMMRDPEGFYDTPWEFSCSPAALLSAGRLANISDKGSATADSRLASHPDPGVDRESRLANGYPDSVRFGGSVRAVSRNSKQPSSVPSREGPTDDEPVWKFRGPEADLRDSEEYDVPWDLKHVDIRLKTGGYGRSIDGWRPMSEIYEPVWSVSKAAASLESQRSIPNNGQHSGKEISRNDFKQIGHHQHAYINRREPSIPRTKQSGASNESNGGSPSTSASSSCDLKSKSSGSLSSSEGTILATKESGTAPPGLSIPYPAHQFVPDEQGYGNRGRSVTKSASTPITPLMETAFCAKTNNISNTGGSKSTKELQKMNREEARERKIQQVCGERNFSHSSESSGRNHSKPVPAVRRSKLKPVNVSASPSQKQHPSSPNKTPVMGTPGTSHLIEIRGTPMVLTTGSSKEGGIKSSFGGRRNLTAAVSEKISPQAQKADTSLATKDFTIDSTTTKRLDQLQQQKLIPPSCQEEYDVPWEFCSSKKLNRLLEKKEKDKQAGDGLDRKTLSLNFGCSRLNPEGDHLNPDIPLQTQEWYHGNVSRVEAEQRLSLAAEGSFLVRLCESNKDEFALSLKSAKGFMHMKIQLDADGKWVLGYFSHPFETIPRMVRYYAINKLPIKGAEHMCLLHPIKDQLL